MNRKQFLFVLAALAALGGAGLVLLRHHEQTWTASTAKTGSSLMPDFKLNEVAAIHVRGNSEFNVVRENGLWRVKEHHNYPANFHQIRQLLFNMRDVKVVQSEPVGPSQLERVELSPPGRNPGSGTLVEFKDAQGKTLDVLLVGKRHERVRNDSVPFGLHGMFDGRYVLLPRAPGNVLLVSDELAGVAPDPEGWLNREFFKVENAKSISLSSIDPAISWALSRASESSPWAIADMKPGEVLDSSLASQPAEILEFPSFADVVSPIQAESYSTPVSPGPGAAELPPESWPTTVTAETFDGFSYALKIGARTSRGTFPLVIAVQANLQSERKAGKEEAPEEQKRLEFQDQAKKLREKLAQEQALAGWVFEVEPSRIEPLMHDRAQFLQKSLLVSEQSSGEPTGSASDIEQPAP